jgi:sorbitol/mannitol transport system permease protein
MSVATQRGAGEGRRTRRGLAPLLAPSVAALLVWMIVPLAMTLWFSLQHYNLLSPAKRAFAGFYNYRYLLTGRALWVAMGNTLLLVGLVLLITLALGTLLAALLDREFPGRNICRLLVIAPFFMMPTVSALIWKNMLMNPVFGMFAWITRSLGLPTVDFFASMPLMAIVVIVAWEWTPFAVLILLPALQSLNPELREAARMEGAGPWALFWHIELPHMLRPMAVVAMIETIFFLSLFAEIYVTTGGGPGPGLHQPGVPDLPRRPVRLGRGRRFGRRRHRHRPRQHRGDLPDAPGGPQPGGSAMKTSWRRAWL